MLTRMARLSLSAPRRVITVVILVMIGTAIFGIPAANSLAAGGFWIHRRNPRVPRRCSPTSSIEATWRWCCW